MARSHLTFVLLCPFVLFASCQLEENPVVNPNDIYRPQIWSLLKYLNSNSERIYNYNRADFVDAQKKDNDVTELTVDVDVECIRKEPEVPCATNVLTCQGSVQYNHQINSYETLSGVSCSPKLSVQIPSADETEELPTQTSSTEPVVNTQNPIELSHEVSSSNSGEQFVAVRSHAKHCLGCPFDLNVDAEGSSVLIETALKHVETERSQKQALVNVLRIQQQIVAGVKYILLIEIAPTVCSKDVQAVDLQSCPVDFSYPTEICEVTYLERPWINKNKYIVRNNCTVSQQFTTPEQKLSESNGNDLDNEIDVNGVYKKNSFPIDIKAKSEPSPNFDKIAESGQMEDVMSPARLAELESQILFKQPVMEPTVMTVPETTQQIFVVETTQNAYDFIETDPISPQIITPKSSLTDEQRGILDEFFLNDEPQQDSSSSEELSKTTNKDNSTEKIVSDESSEEEQRQKRSSSDLEKVSADEKPFVKELADFALNTLDGIDKDNLKRIVLEIQDAKKIKSYGTVYYLSILVGVSKCLENPDGDSHQLNCEENILPDSIKECKVQIQVTEEKKDPKVLKSHCQIVEKKSGARRIKRGLLGGEREIPLSDPTLNNLLQHSLTQYQSSKDGRYRILEVLSASYQIVSGKLYKIQVKIAPTNCLSNDHDSQDCQFLQDGDVKICHIRIWLQPWLPNGRQTNITCEGDDKVYSYRSKRSLHHDNHDNHDYDVDKDLFEEFVKKYNKNYESLDEYRSRFHIFRNNMKLVGQLNAYEQGTARYGATKFADLTREEFSKYLGLRQDLRNENDIPFQKAKIPDVELPVQFDWRTKNAVSEVKDQGQCGSCWAFSVTGNVEGQYAIKNGQLMEFSEQELVDCDNVDEGCNGGLMDNAYRVIEKLGGLETEQDYPYDAEDEKCHFNKTLARVQLSGAVNISTNETDMAKWLVANGPISIAINANAMQFYMGGVSHPWKSLCNPKNLDHGVLIVGYGLHKYPLFNKRLPYWIVKNSWGKSWGEQGYYRVYRGDGTCGLNQTPSSAIVE